MPNAMPHLQRTLRLNLRDTSLLTPRSVLRPNPSSQQTQHMRHLVSRAGPATTRTAQSSTSSSFRQFLSRYRQGVCTPSQLLRSLRQRRPFSSTRARYEQAVPTAEPTSLSARLKKLSREYGWSAFGVYMALSALDFPFCFLAVRWLGTERIGRWEHAVISWFKKAIPINWPGNEGKTDIDAVDGVVEVVGEGIDKGLEKVDGQITGWDHGVRDAQKDNSGETASKFEPALQGIPRDRD
jgi:hypothetical protein